MQLSMRIKQRQTGLQLATVTLVLLAVSSSSMQLQPANECSLQHGLDNVQVLDMEAGIYMYNNFLSEAECDHLIAAAVPRFSRSEVVATKANGTGVGLEHEIRTSSGAAFGRGETDIIKSVEERIAKWVLLPVSHQESMQVLRYGPGQQYRPHWDFFQDNTTVQNGGNRHTTVLVYLSDVEEGGETVFPMLPKQTSEGSAAATTGATSAAAGAGQSSSSLSECAAKHLAVRPKKGTALMWRNLTPEGQLEPRSLHAGCPVIKGTKYAMAKWIRAKPYTTMEDVVARLRQHQAAQQQQQHQQHQAAQQQRQQQQYNVQAFSQLAAALAVAAAR